MEKLKSVDAILWDNDGVLVDTEKLYYRASKQALADIGIDLSWELFRDISLRRGQSVFDLALQSGCSQATCEQLRHRRNRHYAELLHSDTEVIDGVRETLEQLHGKVPMAIVTSSLRDHFDIIHACSDLLKYFEFALTREDYVHSKPHPEPYLAALNRLGIPAHRSLVVEDSERGLQAALRANIPCIVVGSAPDSPGFKDAHAVLPSVKQLPFHLPFSC